MKIIEKLFYVIKSIFLVILRINSNIHVIETFINRLSAFLRQHMRMDPWVLFISQVCTNAFFGKVTESKREKLKMRVLWMRTL